MTKRAMATVTRVADNKEDNGKAGQGNGNSDKGVGQETAMATKRAMATATRVVGEEEVDGNKEGKGKSDEGGG